MAPRFSVVVPLYNKEAYIERSLSSALRQSLPDFEIIVVDDGSTDAGPDRVMGLSDPRLSMTRQKNAGVSVTRNEGIRLSCAPYVAFLDADDVWLPDHLEILNRLIERFPEAGIYTTNYWYLWEHGITPARIAGVPSDTDWEGLLPAYLAAACGGSPPVWTSAACVPRHVLEEFCGFPAGVRTGEDLELWLRIALKYRVAFSSRRTAAYDRQASGAADAIYPEEEAALERWRTYALPESCPDFERYLARRYLDIARKQVLKGDRAGARRTLSTISASYWRKRRWLLSLACRIPSPGLNCCLKVVRSFRRAAARINPRQSVQPPEALLPQ